MASACGVKKFRGSQEIEWVKLINEPIFLFQCVGEINMRLSKIKSALPSLIVLVLIICVSLAALGCGVHYLLWIWNPLARDEQMIENFMTHRADFIEVVHRYRNYQRSPDKDASSWYKEGDTQELYKRAMIVDIDAQGIWLPNPYSAETAKRKYGLVGFEYNRKYGALRISPTCPSCAAHPDQRGDLDHRRNTLLFGTIWKDYYFFPEVPRVESGKLLWPLSVVGKGFPGAQFHEKEGVATIQKKERVLPSLNRLPSHWQESECVYRQIEPQWFIRMCNGH